MGYRYPLSNLYHHVFIAGDRKEVVLTDDLIQYFFMGIFAYSYFSSGVLR